MYKGVLQAVLLVAATAVARVISASLPDKGCESYVPTSSEVRASRPPGWSTEELRGRRSMATVHQSAGSEQDAEGYEAGKCVTGTWTHQKQMPAMGSSGRRTCLEICSSEEGCLGVLYGQVESARGVQVHCLLAGISNSSIVMDYPCSHSELVGCPPPVDVAALTELASTLQCWQKRWVRCPSDNHGQRSQSFADKLLARFVNALNPRRTRDLAWVVLGKLRGLAAQFGKGAVAILPTLGRMADVADAHIFRAMQEFYSRANEALGSEDGVLDFVIFCFALSAACLVLGRIVHNPLRRLLQQRQIVLHDSQVPPLSPQVSAEAEIAPREPGVLSPGLHVPFMGGTSCFSVAVRKGSPEQVPAVELPKALSQSFGSDLQDTSCQTVVAGSADTSNSSQRRSRHATPPKRVLPCSPSSPSIQAVISVEEQVPVMELPKGMPQSFGPDLQDTSCQTLVAGSADTTNSSQRRGRHATPPKRVIPCSPSSPLIQEVILAEDDKNSFRPLSRRAQRIKKFWDEIENSPEDEPVSQPEIELLKSLNHTDVDVIKSIRSIGAVSAAQILEYRSREGDLQRVSELATKVGLKGSLVRRLKAQYGLPEI